MVRVRGETCYAKNLGLRRSAVVAFPHSSHVPSLADWLAVACVGAGGTFVPDQATANQSLPRRNETRSWRLLVRPNSLPLFIGI
ncbi:MAG: hypothetical protein AAF802_06070 [Planctomycetota bacterium]